MKNYALLLGLTLIMTTSVFGEQPPVKRWVARYNGSANSNDGAQAIALDSSGNVYVTGYSGGSGTSGDYATIKYDQNGNQIWVARYNGPGNSDDAAVAIALDSSGNVYVTGTNCGTFCGYATIKYDQNGNQIWVASYNGPGNDFDLAHAIALDSSGNVYVTGLSTGIGTSWDYATIKYDPNGNQIWVARYNGPGNDIDEAFAIALDGSGNVYVTGLSTDSATSCEYATIKYDQNGNQIWVARYKGQENEGHEAFAIALDGSGNVYVTGLSTGSGTSSDYATVKYDQNGNQIWVARYNGPGNSDDAAYAIALDGSGNVYVTGTSTGSGTSGDYATIKYDQNGNQIWVARYNGQGNYWDGAFAIAVDSSGNVYVTGRSYGSGTSGDYTTIKYNQNGNQIWVLSYNGPGNNEDEVLAIALDSSGNVYVTGRSTGSGTSLDYATIKYTQHGFCVGPVVGDLNNDCKVDFEDFAVLASHWLECNYALEEDCW